MARKKCHAKHRSAGNYVPKPTKPQIQSSNVNNCLAASKKNHRPGELALREIHRYTKSSELLIPALSFQRLVREITQDYTPPNTRTYYERMWYEGYRYTKTAMEAIQDATEAYLVELLQDCNAAAAHAKRKTIMKQDIEFVRRLRRDIV
ncbi:hypothetical protein CF319_g7151 [Tilletia indica]|nr:hypothetical protein CF319_g7151 [Tilletia indica]